MKGTGLIFGDRLDLSWWLSVLSCPATMAAMGPLGVIALMQRPGYRPRGVSHAAWADLQAVLLELHAEMTHWADGEPHAGMRARAILDRINGLREPIYRALLGEPWGRNSSFIGTDARRLPTMGFVFDQIGFPVPTRPGKIVPLPVQAKARRSDEPPPDNAA